VHDYGGGGSRGLGSEKFVETAQPYARCQAANHFLLPWFDSGSTFSKDKK
jgi:hypothetical protein